MSKLLERKIFSDISRKSNSSFSVLNYNSRAPGLSMKRREDNQALADIFHLGRIGQKLIQH